MKGKRILATALVLLFALSVALPVLAATSQVYATTNVNVRKGPGTKYAVLGYLTTNQVVTKLGTSGKWTKINYSGATAYVSSTYVRALHRHYHGYRHQRLGSCQRHRAGIQRAPVPRIHSWVR